MGEEYFLPVLKNCPRAKAHIPSQTFHKERKSPFYLPAQTPPNTSFPLAPESSSTFKLAKNYQIHHKELWGLPDSQLRPPTPISESYLAGRGILFLDKQQSGAPVPWLPGQPITAACMLPSSPGEGAQRLSQGQEKTWQYRARLRKGAGAPTPSQPREVICIPLLQIQQLPHLRLWDERTGDFPTLPRKSPAQIPSKRPREPLPKPQE